VFDGDEWFDGGLSRPITDLDRDGSAADQATYYDDGNNWLDDAERDEDADGLTNEWESTGCMTRGYWDSLYDQETKYYLAYAAVRLDDPDSDGDDVLDGADDQDHDGVPNVMECSRSLALGADHLGDFKDPSTYTPAAPWRSWQGFVNPFNPCRTPNRRPASSTCSSAAARASGRRSTRTRSTTASRTEPCSHTEARHPAGLGRFVQESRRTHPQPGGERWPTASTASPR
jgi:hypothetical protein